jgi:hypothetical protein
MVQCGQNQHLFEESICKEFLDGYALDFKFDRSHGKTVVEIFYPSKNSCHLAKLRILTVSQLHSAFCQSDKANKL